LTCGIITDLAGECIPRATLGWLSHCQWHLYDTWPSYDFLLLSNHVVYFQQQKQEALVRKN